MMKSVLLLALVAAASATTELNGATFDDAIAGKGAFVKFYAPWCGHCKKMAPVWNELAEGFDSSKSVVIADVDCTKDESKDLCSKYGVKGYPTIKYFTASAPDGAAYEGGRDLSALKEFASENLGPSCSPDTLDLCDEAQVVEIKAMQAKSQEEIQTMVDAATKAVDDAEKTFKDEVAKLQATYQQLSTDKDAAVAAAATPELRVAKMVLASLKKAADTGAKDEL